MARLVAAKLAKPILLPVVCGKEKQPGQPRGIGPVGQQEVVMVG